MFNIFHKQIVGLKLFSSIFHKQNVGLKLLSREVSVRLH